MNPDHVLQLFIEMSNNEDITTTLNNIVSEFTPLETGERIYCTEENNSSQLNVKYDEDEPLLSLIEVLEGAFSGHVTYLEGVQLSKQSHINHINLLNDTLGMLYNQLDEDCVISDVILDVDEYTYLYRLSFYKIVYEVLPEIELKIPIIVQDQYSYSDVALIAPYSSLEIAYGDLAVVSCHENMNTHNGPVALERFLASLSRVYPISLPKHFPTIEETNIEAARYIKFTADLLSDDVLSLLRETQNEYENFYKGGD